MDTISFDEIVSVLDMNDRHDLINHFKEHIKINEDYINIIIYKEDIERLKNIIERLKSQLM